MEQTTDKITVIVVDDHEVTRKGLRMVLDQEPDIAVVGEAADGEEALALVEALRPCVVLWDIEMPKLDGISLEKRLRERYGDTVIGLPLTAHDRDDYIAKAMDAGAQGFMLKEESTQRIVNGIRDAHAGRMVFTDAQWARARRWREEVLARWEALTKRERAILTLSAQRRPIPDIAQALGIQDSTVRTHLSNAVKKLGFGSKAMAEVWVCQQGLVPATPSGQNDQVDLDK
jgi:DNA-binding NarL/FixJ family response regulator